MMVVITRRIRRTVSTPESRELSQLRERTRQALNKPFKFEPKEVIPPWKLNNPDPMVSLFKPFSQVLPLSLAPTVEEISSGIRTLSWRRVLPPIAAGAFLIALFTIWQSLVIIGRYPATVAQVAPKLTNTRLANPASIPSGSSIPSGIKLDSTAPLRSNPASSPTNLTAPSGGGGSTAPSGGSASQAAPAPTPTCASGSICSGVDMTGAPCTVSNPCHGVSLGSLGTVLIH